MLRITMDICEIGIIEFIRFSRSLRMSMNDFNLDKYFHWMVKIKKRGSFLWFAMLEYLTA